MKTTTKTDIQVRQALEYNQAGFKLTQYGDKKTVCFFHWFEARLTTMKDGEITYVAHYRDLTGVKERLLFDIFDDIKISSSLLPVLYDLIPLTLTPTQVDQYDDFTTLVSGARYNLNKLISEDDIIDHCEILSGYVSKVSKMLKSVKARKNYHNRKCNRELRTLYLIQSHILTDLKKRLIDDLETYETKFSYLFELPTILTMSVPCTNKLADQATLRMDTLSTVLGGNVNIIIGADLKTGETIELIISCMTESHDLLLRVYSYLTTYDSRVMDQALTEIKHFQEMN